MGQADRWTQAHALVSQRPLEVVSCAKIASHGKNCVDSQIRPSQNCAIIVLHNFLVGLCNRTFSYLLQKVKLLNN